MILRNGEIAPEFSLPEHSGNAVGSEDLFKKVCVLVFYRGAFCPTTDRYLTAYQDFFGRLKEIEVNLVFISADTVEKHAEQATKFRTKFSLLSDVDLTVAEKYGTYIAEHKGARYCEPALYIVDIEGKITYSIISSGPKGLPSPTDIAPILMYMKSHKGKY